MSRPDPGSPGTPWLRAARWVCAITALVAALFAVAVLGSLWIEERGGAGERLLDDAPLVQLREGVRAQPEDEALRHQLRVWDAEIRRSYRARLLHRRRAAGLLLGAVALLLAALKLRSALAPPAVPRPAAVGSGLGTAPAASRWAVALVGSLVLGALLWTALFEGSSLPAPDVAPPPSVAERWSQRQQHWPGLRGPDGLGTAPGARPPLDWDGDSGRNVRWKVEVPRPGFGSPVVWGDRVFLSGADEQHRELYCFHADSGELLWRHDAGIPGGRATPLPRVSSDTGHAASTPATDGLRVFALFSNGDLVAVDFDGVRVWSQQLGVPDNPYGHSSSLLVWRDRLIVQWDQRDLAVVLAFDTASGELVWQSVRQLEVSWSSPVLIPGADGAQLVLNGNPAVIAYDPRTGSEAWRVAALRGELASTPAFGAGKVFVAHRGARLAAILPGEDPAIAWEHSEELPEVSSPVADASLVCLANGYGAVSCLDGDSGELRWRQELDEGFYASPILVGRRLYLLDRGGTMHIFDALDGGRPLGRAALGEPADATGAFVEDRIYLRGRDHLFCIGEEAP